MMAIIGVPTTRQRCGDLARRRRSIDGHDPVALGTEDVGDLQIVLADGGHLLDGFEHVTGGALAREALVRGLCLEVEQQRQVGVSHVPVQRPHPVQVAPKRLVRERRQVAAVADHPLAASERRDDLPVHVVEAVGCEEQGEQLRRQLLALAARPRAGQRLPDHLADQAIGRLERLDDGEPLPAQPLRGAGRLRRRPAPVDPLKHDELAVGHCRTSIRMVAHNLPHRMRRVNCAGRSDDPPV